jgi:hypothetical protein
MKKLVARQRVEAGERVDALDRFVTDEPNRLVKMNAELIRNSKAFKDGGDYNPLEVILLKHFLEEPEARLRDVAAAREVTVKNLAEVTNAKIEGAKAFKARYERCLQDLAMKEGLGQKYGGPRRNAQERFRTEITRDEQAAGELDECIDTLESLSREAQVATREAAALISLEIGDDDGSSSSSSSVNIPLPVVASEADAIATPFSLKIRRKFMQIRIAAFRRASYLEFLPRSDTVDISIAVPQDLEVEELERSARRNDSGDPEEEEVYQTMTFEASITDLEDRCRNETRDLYVSEGKEAALGPDGVPESLQNWLMESHAKALVHREKACRRLRAQVERLEVLLAKSPVPPDVDTLCAPAAGVVDVATRAQQRAVAMRRERKSAFDAKMSQWEARRTVHSGTLRPQLGSPNAAEELEALIAAEAERTREVQDGIRTTKREVLCELEALAGRFVDRMTANVAATMILLDTTVMRDDLGYLPGDELIEPKRKSLKRLKKAHRVRMNARVEEGEEGSGGGGEGDGGVAPGPPKPRDAMNPTGREWLKRTWPGLPAMEKLPASLTKAVVDGEEEEGEEKIESVSVPDGVRSYVTTAHRVLLKARDAQYAVYTSAFAQNVDTVTKRYDALLQKELQWAENWQTLVNTLRNDEA